VATDVHDVDHHVWVMALCEVPLYGFIGTVCIADQHSKILLHDVVESLFDLRIQPRHSARAGNKYAFHPSTSRTRERDRVNGFYVTLLLKCLGHDIHGCTGLKQIIDQQYLLSFDISAKCEYGLQCCDPFRKITDILHLGSSFRLLKRRGIERNLKCLAQFGGDLDDRLEGTL